MRRRIGLAVVAVSLTLISGCDTQRLNQFSSFATAGSLYVTTLHQVIAQAGSAMIAVDSATLVTARMLADGSVQANPDKYRKDVATDDQLLQRNLATLQLIDQHATLLGSYFNAISNLTNGKAATGVSGAATDLLNSIGELNPKISSAKVGGQTVQSLVQEGSSVVVTHFEVKALDDQLVKAAPIIGAALSLQAAAMNLIATQLKADMQASLEVKESTEVIEPYVAKGDIPANWNSTREAFLRSKITLDSVNSAQAAIKQLNISFKELVENKNASVDLVTLINDIAKMAGVASTVQSSLSGPVK